MNQIKRYMGIVWMLLGPIAVFFTISEALKANDRAITKIGSAAGEAAKSAAELAKVNTNLQWGIIITVFVPIMVGMVIFGYYAIVGAYDHLPEDSSELED